MYIINPFINFTPIPSFLGGCLIGLAVAIFLISFSEIADDKTEGCSIPATHSPLDEFPFQSDQNTQYRFSILQEIEMTF